MTAVAIIAVLNLPVQLPRGLGTRSLIFLYGSIKVLTILGEQVYNLYGEARFGAKAIVPENGTLAKCGLHTLLNGLYTIFWD